MSHKKSDKKLQEAFNEMDAQDFLAAQERKDQIWSDLDINKPEKKSKSKYLVGFIFLGGLVAAYFLGSQCVQNAVPEPTQNTNHWAIQIEDLKSELEQTKKQLEQNNFQKEGLNNKLKELQAQLNTLVLDDSDASPTTAYIEKLIYKTDTLYITKVEKQDRIVEKVIRDTVYLELPVPIQENEPMAMLENEDSKQNEIKKESEENINTKPSSVQFNFSEIDLNKK